MEETKRMDGSVRGAEAQAEQGTAEQGGNLGKFKSVGALLEAYNSLEAEFTRRSQRLRELEAQAAIGAAANGGAPRSGETSEPAPTAEEPAVLSADGAGAGEIPQTIKNEIVAEYLARLRRGAPEVLAGGGSFVSAPAERAKTLKDAAVQAAELIKKNLRGV